MSFSIGIKLSWEVLDVNFFQEKLQYIRCNSIFSPIFSIEYICFLYLSDDVNTGINLKKSKLVKIILILTALCMSILAPVTAQTVEKSGPYANELLFKIYLYPEVEYLALKTGDINIMDWELPAEKVADALADPTISTDSTADLGYYLIDINCQKSDIQNV